MPTHAAKPGDDALEDGKRGKLEKLQGDVLPEVVPEGTTGRSPAPRGPPTTPKTVSPKVSPRRP